MRAIELETRVISAVDRIRSKQRVEDDFVECKRSWPTGDKARQLAGSLNRGGGDPVIYIIGVDEKTGEIHDVSDTDIHDWWAQITPRFDQLPPEIVRHMVVPIVEGQNVVAVAFASDRAPYVVKTGTAKPSLEVPIREGTATRTARRDELLRILIPSLSVPSVTLLEAEFRVVDTVSLDGSFEDEVYANGELTLYFEHDGKDPVTLPNHGMHGKLIAGNEEFAMKVAALPIDGSGGIRLESPKAVRFHVEVLNIAMSDVAHFDPQSVLTCTLDLEVVHAPRTVHAKVVMPRQKVSQYPNVNTAYVETRRYWRFGRPGI